ncbi:MAG: uracil-DNA glycosylase [Candidatus Jordarchaeum sp.]|uniref:uracil-DNA glycosylase n=1 Tax=Candidatus Jordarchaeum sp. TaxID=2823881 RepID=UPI00404B06B6
MSEDSLKQLSRKTTLKEVYDIAKNCVRCPLSKSRINVVFGEGDPHAKIMFVGEAPGEQEDIQARPFVGRAGKFLDHLIKLAGLERSKVYISNVVKCRPPNNRKPRKDEIEKCNPYLQKQIELINPKVICILGNVSLTSLLGKTGPIGELRGNPIQKEGITYFPTFHPAAVLYRPAAKEEMEKDMLTLKGYLDEYKINV